MPPAPRTPNLPEPARSALALYEKGRFEELIRLVDESLPKAWPEQDWQDLLALRGLARLRLGRNFDAGADFDDVLKAQHDPLSFARANAAYGRGKLKHLKGDIWGAFQDFSISLEASVAGGGRPLDRESRGTMERVLEEAKPSGAGDPFYHLQRGNFYRMTGDLTKAVEELSRAAQLKPDNPTIQVRLGDAFLACGDLARSREAYAAARAQDPGRPAPLLGLAQVAVREGKTDEAFALLTEARPLLDDPKLLETNDAFAPLHSDPRWPKLLM